MRIKHIQENEVEYKEWKSPYKVIVKLYKKDFLNLKRGDVIVLHDNGGTWNGEIVNKFSSGDTYNVYIY